MIERKTGQQIYKEIANLGNQIQRQDVKNKVWVYRDSELEFLQKILDVYEDDKELHDDYFYVTIRERIKELMNDEN